MQQRAALSGNFAAVLLDLRPGGAQKTHQVADLRLARGVFDHRLAIAAHRRQNGVFRRADAGKRQADAPTVQVFRAALGKMPPHRHLRAQRLQGEDVQVDRALSQRAAARQRDARAPHARQQRAEKQNGRPQPSGILRRELPAAKRPRVHDQRPAAPFGAAAEAAQHFQCIAHIADVRAVM